jgi:hypothetical protein
MGHLMSLLSVHSLLHSSVHLTLQFPPLLSHSSVFLLLFYTVLGTLLLNLTGHRDLVTNIELRALSVSMATTGAGAVTGTGAGEGAAAGAGVEETQSRTKSGEIATDVLVSVSDDHTARVFYFSGLSLLS